MAVKNPPALEYLWDRLQELEPGTKLGGIATNKPGYHNSRQNLPSNDYSVVDKPDKGGPSDYAAALDWTFPDAQAGDYTTIKKYSQRLLASGQDANDTRLDWMREFFGQTDNDGTVEGWDYRYAEASTSADTSHNWHIHFSISRDALTNANMDKLVEVLRGDDDMALSDADLEKIVNAVYHRDGTCAVANKYYPWRTDSPAHTPPGTNDWVTGGTAVIEAAGRGEAARLAAQAASDKLDTILAGGTSVIVGPELLKQVMLDPQVVETYAKAIGDQIIGLRYEREQ